MLAATGHSFVTIHGRLLSSATFECLVHRRIVPSLPSTSSLTPRDAVTDLVNAYIMP